MMASAFVPLFVNIYSVPIALLQNVCYNNNKKGFCMETFTWVPDYQLSKQYKPEIKPTKFGDGYTQRTKVGANKNRKTLSCRFTGLFDKINAIDTFLSAMDGRTDFYFTEPDNSVDIFYCEEWDVDYSDYNNHSLSAVFKQR